MDILLSRVTQQAVQYAIRSGISITTGYAISSAARLLKEAPKSKDREELMQLQLRLESKIRVISPSIDMIELISARGNTSLESAVSLTKDIRYEIQKLGVRLSKAAEEEAMVRRKSSKAKTREETNVELHLIINQVKLLLARIEDAVPLINLAITTSGVNLNCKLSGSISPSRLLQASTFLTSADGAYSNTSALRQQVGPTYILTMYMLFAGHAGRPADENGVRETTWKEVIHKARVKLWRLPVDQLYALPGETLDVDESAENTIPADAKTSEFAYQLAIVEDLDDDRVHTFEEDEPRPPPVDDVDNAGIRDVIPIHEVSKIFYADTGKILNIGSDGDAYSPVLLLKRDVHAEPPRRMVRRSQSRANFSDDGTVNANDEVLDEQSEIDAQFERESTPNTPFQPAYEPSPADEPSFRLPADLDPEWYAFEVYTEETESESDDEADTTRPSYDRSDSLTSRLAHLTMRSSPAAGEHNQLVQSQSSGPDFSPKKRTGPPIKTSLSLLEMLMKLAALQQFRQESHLAIEDELLNFFLEDSATAGAGADKDYRQRLRHQATKRVGFDPYDESPIKHRNEDYIRGLNDGASQRGSPMPDGWQLSSEIGFGEDAFGYNNDQQPLSRFDYVQNSIERRTTPSSPPPRPMPYQQTTPRASTPDAVSSESHRNAVTAKYRTASPRSPSIATPPSSSKMRSGVLRSQSEQKPRSPLRESVNRAEEE